MKRFLFASIVALVAAVSLSGSASAQTPFPANYGFFPWGFYQPYGAAYDTGIRTPPYFAINPPVYYGARHARPYGLSPFASPPLVSPAENYRSRLRSQFLQPRVPTPAPICNPYVCESDAVKPSANKVAVSKPAQIGSVRRNPFVESIDRVAQR